MIALPVLSQKKYIINNDTLICYTIKENRAIAILLLKGDKASANNISDSLIIKTLEKDKIILSNKLVIYKEQLDLNTAQIKQLNSELIECKEKQNKSHRWAVTWRTLTFITSGVIALLYVLK